MASASSSQTASQIYLKKKARVLDAIVGTLLQNINITMGDDSGEESDDSGYSAWNVNGY